jgi:hypothetical protein
MAQSFRRFHLFLSLTFYKHIWCQVEASVYEVSKPRSGAEDALLWARIYPALIINAEQHFRLDRNWRSFWFQWLVQIHVHFIRTLPYVSCNKHGKRSCIYEYISLNAWMRIQLCAIGEERVNMISSRIGGYVNIPCVLQSRVQVGI